MHCAQELTLLLSQEKLLAESLHQSSLLQAIQFSAGGGGSLAHADAHSEPAMSVSAMTLIASDGSRRPQGVKPVQSRHGTPGVKIAYAQLNTGAPRKSTRKETIL